MAIKGVTPVLNVSDVPASLVWFESLGWKRGFTWNDGGMIEGAGDRNADGDDMTDGVWMSWWIDSVPSLDELHATAVTLGYVVTMPPTNEPWGVREFHLRHPDGHMFRVSTGLSR